MKFLSIYLLVLLAIVAVAAVDNDIVTVLEVDNALPHFGSDDKTDFSDSGANQVELLAESKHDEQSATFTQEQLLTKEVADLLNSAMRYGCKKQTTWYNGSNPPQFKITNVLDGSLRVMIKDDDENEIHMHLSYSQVAEAGQSNFSIVCMYMPGKNCICDDKDSPLCVKSAEPCQREQHGPTKLDSSDDDSYMNWVEEHNKSNASWKAVFVAKQDRARTIATGYDMKAAERMMALQVDADYNFDDALATARADINAGKVPTSFDFRAAAPECADTQQVMDQEKCGICYAMATTSVLSGRLCMTSNKRYTALLARQSIVSCKKSSKDSSKYVNACTKEEEGGFSMTEYNRLSKDNSSYNAKMDLVSFDFCDPYSGRTSGTEENCGTSCLNPELWKTTKTYNANISSTITFSTSGIGSFRHVRPQSQTDKSYQWSQKDSDEVWDVCRAMIASGGPVGMRFQVFNDLSGYKSGVYEPAAGAVGAEFHEVSVLGYGTENGKDYWLVQNSWGTWFGLGGLIKYRARANIGNIEDGGCVTPNIATDGDYGRCLNTPCKNGGGNYSNDCSCKCKSPWTGQNCDQCNVVCKDTNSTCYDTTNCGCKCKAGYFGRDCSDFVKVSNDNQGKLTIEWSVKNAVPGDYIGWMKPAAAQGDLPLMMESGQNGRYIPHQSSLQVYLCGSSDAWDGKTNCPQTGKQQISSFRPMCQCPAGQVFNYDSKECGACPNGSTCQACDNASYFDVASSTCKQCGYGMFWDDKNNGTYQLAYVAYLGKNEFGSDLGHEMPGQGYSTLVRGTFVFPLTVTIARGEGTSAGFITSSAINSVLKQETCGVPASPLTAAEKDQIAKEKDQIAKDAADAAEANRRANIARCTKACNTNNSCKDFTTCTCACKPGYFGDTCNYFVKVSADSSASDQLTVDFNIPNTKPGDRFALVPTPGKQGDVPEAMVCTARCISKLEWTSSICDANATSCSRTQVRFLARMFSPCGDDGGNFKSCPGRNWNRTEDQNMTKKYQLLYMAANGRSVDWDVSYTFSENKSLALPFWIDVKAKLDYDNNINVMVATTITSFIPPLAPYNVKCEA